MNLKVKGPRLPGLLEGKCVGHLFLGQLAVRCRDERTGAPSQCVQALAQMGNRMVWRDWKVPCFPGTVSIREKRLHCRSK